MSTPHQSNIAIRSNIWIDPDSPDRTSCWMAEKQIPGDLMVEFLASENPLSNPREKQVLQSRLTATQLDEYHVRRFFLNQGEVGAAYEE